MSGTVTFLFTDIEGSTRLEQTVGTARYAELLERHRALLRAAFTEHGGHVQGVEGDSFFVVFGTAREALAAAVDGQRALAAEPWPDESPIRVRMGLHSGEASTAGGFLVGLDINRAARISSAAHGGQILVSDPTRALAGGSLPAGVSLRDLGAFRLRDLRAPERLLQVVAEGLPDTFPRPRTPDARPNNLPTQLTTFVGRDRELAEAGALLGTSRLLTFTGPGGTGKTRLSIQVAASMADRFPDGIWFVPLEAVRDPELVAPTIARTLGTVDSLTRASVDAIVETIGEGHVLLVLDNFEQVVGAGPAVTELLRRCRDLSVIVTTRIALHVSGEQEYPVPGLPAPPDTRQLSEVERLNLPRELREVDIDTLTTYEAVRLFIARATSVRPGFAITNANAPAVAAICARLQGMPLAIELAAARVRLLTPDQILARLERHLDLLTAGSRDLPERQQTLRGAIAWSYDLLDAGARRLVDRLSVFRGGFDLDTAVTVCGPAAEVGGDVLDRIGELVDQSLVRIDEASAEPRATMLETIREYAEERLEARGEADAIRARHATAMLELAQAAAPHLSGVDQRAWLDRLERDHDNLRAALDRATAAPKPAVAARLAYALWRFWQQRGYLNEARGRFEAMAAQDWALEPVDRAHFAEAFGGVGYWQTDAAVAIHWYDEALAIWRSIGDRAEIANALYDRAYASLVVVMGGARDPATIAAGRAMLEEALGIYRELGDQAGEGNVVWGLGSYAYFTGDAATGEGWYRQSLELHRASGQRTMEAWSLHMLALARASQDSWSEALDLAQHALRHFYESGDVAGVTLVLDDLAIIAGTTGDVVRSGRLYGAARHLQHTTGTALADYSAQHFDLYGIVTPDQMLPAEGLERDAADGAALSLDEVVAYALGVEGPPPTSHEESDPVAG